MLYRHPGGLIEGRLQKMPTPEGKIAKRLELEFAAVLMRTSGIGDGDAFRAAEECARDPMALAIRLHQIATDYLTAHAALREQK